MVDFKKKLDQTKLAKTLAQVAKEAAPSMLPLPLEVDKKPKKKADFLPPLEETDLTLADKLALARLTEIHVDILQQEKELRDAKKPLVGRIKGIIGERLWGAMVGVNRVRMYQTSRTSVSTDLLLAQGVSPQIIAKATKVTTSWGLKITPPGEDDDE